MKFQGRSFLKEVDLTNSDDVHNLVKNVEEKKNSS